MSPFHALCRCHPIPRLLLLPGLFLALAAEEAPPAPAPVEDINRVRENLAEALAYRDQAATEAADWALRQADLKNLLAALQSEVEALRETVETSRQLLEDMEAREAEADRKAGQRKRYREELAARLVPLSEALLAESRRWPEPLQTATAARLEELKRPISPGRESTDLRGRLEAVLAVMETAQDFQSRVNRGTISRVREDGTVGVYEVVFAGLAVGYFLAPELPEAGIIRFDGKAWNWEQRPELAAPLARFFAVLEGDRTPEFIHLPLPAMGATANVGGGTHE